MDQKQPETTFETKKPYRAPVLTTLGDLKTLTSAKGGSSFDGGGKPRTRMGGTPA